MMMGCALLFNLLMLTICCTLGTRYLALCTRPGRHQEFYQDLHLVYDGSPEASEIPATTLR